MTIDEVIKRAEETAKHHEDIIETGLIFDDVTIDEFYADDTEIIDEYLNNCRSCADEYHQIAEWLKELKELKRKPNETIRSTEQKLRKGHWITRPHVYGAVFCSECDFELKADNTNFCPQCGIDMREVEE